MLQSIHLKTQHYSPENLIPRQHCCQNLESRTYEEQQNINYASNTAKVMRQQIKQMEHLTPMDTQEFCRSFRLYSNAKIHITQCGKINTIKVEKSTMLWFSNQVSWHSKMCL